MPAWRVRKGRHRYPDIHPPLSFCGDGRDDDPRNTRDARGRFLFRTFVAPRIHPSCASSCQGLCPSPPWRWPSVVSLQPPPVRLEIAQSVVKGGRARRCTAEVTLSQGGPGPVARLSSPPPPAAPHTAPCPAWRFRGPRPLAIRRNTQRPISPIFCQSGEKKRRRDARPTLFTFLSFRSCQVCRTILCQDELFTPRREVLPTPQLWIARGYCRRGRSRG